MDMVKKFTLPLLICLALLVSQIGILPGKAAPTATIYHVSPTGANTTTCGTESEPCQTIQKAVNLASTGAIILVAAGTYSTPPDSPPGECYTFTSTKSVVCLIDKQLTIRGGYSPTNWEVSDPVANPTIIDGVSVYRGITVLENATTVAKTSLNLEGFTIQNCRASGNITASGGGMFIDKAALSIRNVIFQNNKSIGGNTTLAAGGTSSGGGLTISDMPVGSTGMLENLTFINNEARGGIGKDRGGLALGGGFYIWRGFVNASNIIVTNNLAQGGNTTGSGRDASLMVAEAAGGAFSIHEGTAEISHAMVIQNSAIGGNGATYAGGGYGGGIELESDSYLRISDSVIQSNHATGGNAQNGAMAGGGGFLWDRTTVILDRVRVIGNTVKGGTGTLQRGSAVGGGVHGMRTAGEATITVLNTLIANNSIEFGDGTGSAIFGAGGGMYIQGYPAEIRHSTFSGNSLDSEMLYGVAITISSANSVPSYVSIIHSLITNHVNSNPEVTQSTLHAMTGSVFNLNRGLFAGNTLDTNIDGNPPNSGGPGIFNGMDTMLYASSAGYISAGAPYYNYHLSLNSPARDQALNSTIPVDFENDNRPFGSTADIGADEYTLFSFSVTPFYTGALFLNWSSSALDSYPLLNGIDHYEVIVTCPPGADPPDQGSCDTPIPTGSNTSLGLTGLTINSQYLFSIQAKDSSGTILAISTQVQGTPGICISLPVIYR